jgi:hypothetical protein
MALPSGTRGTLIIERCADDSSVASGPTVSPAQNRPRPCSELDVTTVSRVHQNYLQSDRQPTFAIEFVGARHPSMLAHHCGLIRVLYPSAGGGHENAVVQVAPPSVVERS